MLYRLKKFRESVLSHHFLSCSFRELSLWTSSEQKIAQALLYARNIAYVTDCTELKGLTVAAAFAKAALPGGGAVLATFDCWEENYDSSVACSGFGSTAREVTCSKDGFTTIDNCAAGPTITAPSPRHHRAITAPSPHHPRTRSCDFT